MKKTREINTEYCEFLEVGLMDNCETCTVNDVCKRLDKKIEVFLKKKKMEEKNEEN